MYDCLTPGYWRIPLRWFFNRDYRARIAQLRHATGLPASVCARILARDLITCYEHSLQSLVEQRQSDVPLYYDPIEDDPRHTDAMKSVDESLEDRLAAGDHGLEFYFTWWEEKKRLLKQHGIDWLDPHDMNPNWEFD